MNPDLIGLVVGGIAGLAFPPVLVMAAARAGGNGGVRDRRGLLDSALTAVIGVLLCRAMVPWQVVPPLLWAVPVAVTVFGLVLAVRAWPGLPWLTGRYRPLAVLGTLLTVVVTGIVALTAV